MTMKHLFKATLLLMALMLPVIATAHDFEVDGVYYNINGNDATVTVTSSPSLNQYSGEVVIPTIVIYNGTSYFVTSIGSFAFNGCTGMTSITIPNSVTEIKECAFQSCRGLTSVIIPNSVTTIDSSAFVACSGLTSVNVESGNTKYDSRNNCNAIIETATNTLIAGCMNSVIPNSVTDIGNYAFAGCSGLKSITIPNSVISIGFNAFGGAGLTSLIIPDAVTTIGESAFESCTGLTTVTIGKSVKSIGHWAFQGCTSLITLNFNAIACEPFGYDLDEGMNQQFDYSNIPFGGLNINTINIGDSVGVIPGCFAYGLTQLTEVTIGKSVGYIPPRAFRGCSALKTINYNAVSCVFSSNISYYYGEKYHPFYSLNISSINIGNDVQRIPPFFASVLHLTEMTIPRSVTHIGMGAFWCGLQTLNYNATSCDLELMDDYDGDLRGPFGWVSTINIGDDVDSIPYCFAYGNTNLSSIDLNSVHYIGKSAFEGCSGLTSITIPCSVSEIGESAFYGCNNLTRVNITDIVAWCNINFHYNPLIYAHHLFLNDVEVTDLIIPDSASKISSYAFWGCDGLTSVTIPKSITSIGTYAFYGCNGLTDVITYIPNPLNISYVSYDGYGYIEIFNLYNYPPDYSNRTLHVPYGSANAYLAHSLWYPYFGTIVEMDPDFVFEIDGVYYSITSDNEVVVARSEEAYQGVIIVPSTVTYDGVTYTVTGIGYDTFANANLSHLVLPVTITAIDNTAFTDCHIGSLVITGNGTWIAGAIPANVDQLYVMSGVTGIQGLQVNPATIYSYATVPPTCNGQTFTGYDGELHVPASSLASYFTAPYWNYFINITGDAVEPTDVSLNKDSVDLLVGNQLTLTATPAPANTTPGIIVWASSNDQVATVMNGEITAVAVGECDIKAILLDKVAVCHVTVTEIPPTELTINQTFAKLEVGSQLTLTATILPEDATDKVVTWASINAAVATVDDQGNVTAVGSGECDITATCRDMQATCHVVVVEHFIYITLDQHKANLLPNHILLLTPSVSPVSTDLVVTSSNPEVAAARMANDKIQVVGITEGVTTITVNSTDGYAEPDSCVVTVYTERGDLNMDGFVNMDDLTAMINYLLTNNAEGISLYNANVDLNDGVSMDDLTALINYLLTNQWPVVPEEPVEPEGTQTITVNGVSFKMVPVEGGTFTMGATAEQGSDAQSNEQPAHEVTVSGFNIGQTEVTQALWQAVMGDNPSSFNDDQNRPVECVSWNDCQTFIVQLNALTGKHFRLPTEAEWEFAARGGNKSEGHKFAGSDNIDEVGWYMGNIPSQTSGTPGYGTQPVAAKAPNELGLYDMSGNVWEWCQDWMGNYSSDAQTDPNGPATGTTRIVRGGSWFNNYATGCRVSRRNGCYTTDADTYLGLRLVLDDAEEYTVNGVSFTMVPVKGGTFTMGATVEEDADYQVFVGSPKHQVTLSDYAIGQTEVTQELWLAVMGSNPSENTGDLQRPVDNVRRAECDSFIVRLNALTGKQFRLPTEAEWEFAARGGNLSQGYTYAGSDDIDEVAWYSGNSGSVSHAVGTKAPNELGIYDMCGNVNEWCNDWYSLYTEDPVTNPTGPATGMSQIHRGGRYASSVKYCRITRRDGFAPGNRRAYLGFRIAQ